MKHLALTFMLLAIPASEQQPAAPTQQTAAPTVAPQPSVDQLKAQIADLQSKLAVATRPTPDQEKKRIFDGLQATRQQYNNAAQACRDAKGTFKLTADLTHGAVTGVCELER